jgi:hypothetical protein
VDAATAPLPELLRAMIRLLVCAVIDRRHAPGDGHLGGIAAGDNDTRTGKTLIACAVCAAFGLDPVAHIREVAKQTEPSLWGRRAATTGGRYVLVPADVLCYRFLALDELDKAKGGLRDAALRLLQGDARIPAEGQVVEVAPAVYATSNGGLAVIPASYRCRSVCLDTTGFEPVPYTAARAVLGAMPRLPLAHLAPAPGLPAATLDAMGEVLQVCLTGEGLAAV